MNKIIANYLSLLKNLFQCFQKISNLLLKMSKSIIIVISFEQQQLDIFLFYNFRLPASHPQSIEPREVPLNIYSQISKLLSGGLVIEEFACLKLTENYHKSETTNIIFKLKEITKISFVFNPVCTSSMYLFRFLAKTGERLFHFSDQYVLEPTRVEVNNLLLKYFYCKPDFIVWGEFINKNLQIEVSVNLFLLKNYAYEDSMKMFLLRKKNLLFSLKENQNLFLYSNALLKFISKETMWSLNHYDSKPQKIQDQTVISSNWIKEKRNDIAENKKLSIEFPLIYKDKKNTKEFYNSLIVILDFKKFGNLSIAKQEIRNKKINSLLRDLFLQLKFKSQSSVLMTKYENNKKEMFENQIELMSSTIYDLNNLVKYDQYYQNILSKMKKEFKLDDIKWVKNKILQNMILNKNKFLENN